jgi:hypothetical protein
VFREYLLKPRASSNWTRYHEVVGLLQDRELVYVTDDIVQETPTKNVSFPFRIFSKQEKKIHTLFVQVLLIAVRYSHSLQTD